MTDQKKVIWILGSVAALVVGVIVIPRLMKKYRGKLYKNSHKDIDFDDYGPEIVKKDAKEEEW